MQYACSVEFTHVTDPPRLFPQTHLPLLHTRSGRQHHHVAATQERRGHGRQY